MFSLASSAFTFVTVWEGKGCFALSADKLLGSSCRSYVEMRALEISPQKSKSVLHKEVSSQDTQRKKT